jgi:hypothetical protein
MKSTSLLCLLSIFLLLGCSKSDWRTADRSSAGVALTPKEEPEALVHIYIARAYKWRGYFGVHSWIATKEKNADHYMTYQVVGFQLRHRGTTVRTGKDMPDRLWYDAMPTLIHELKGKAAEQAIPKIQQAVQSYPHAQSYRVWPGPNSNTFVSYIIRQTPELGVELPPHAIGKDWINSGFFAGRSESGTGFQISLFAVLGITLGLAEGIELNLFGLNFGIDFLRPALKLPLIGRVGMRDSPVFDST